MDIGEAAREVGNICNAYNAIDIDFTVLLTHIGFEEDKKLAAMLDPDWGVDVIIGGHSHTKLEEPFKVNDIYIVQAGTGTQLERMIRHILRDEAFQGEHTEFYQFSHGTHIVWSRSEQTFRTLTLDGEALYDERLYTCLLYTSVQSALPRRNGVPFLLAEGGMAFLPPQAHQATVSAHGQQPAHG